MITFGIWLGVLLGVLFLIIRSTKRRGVDRRTEEVASDALPQIGEIAERAHNARFGRPPTNLPVPPDGRSKQPSWYPPSKTQRRSV